MATMDRTEEQGVRFHLLSLGLANMQIEDKPEQLAVLAAEYISLVCQF